MSKKIIQCFREKDYAFFIDLADAPASVSVNKSNGEMLLFEGDGEDRYHGALIGPESFHGFALDLTEQDEWAVLLKFSGGPPHELGVTSAPEEATRWLRGAAEVIRAAQAKAFTKPEKELAQAAA
jgi:hypothetical protein